MKRKALSRPLSILSDILIPSKQSCIKIPKHCLSHHVPALMAYPNVVFPSLKTMFRTNMMANHMIAARFDKDFSLKDRAVNEIS